MNALTWCLDGAFTPVHYSIGAKSTSRRTRELYIPSIGAEPNHSSKKPTCRELSASVCRSAFAEDLRTTSTDRGTRRDGSTLNCSPGRIVDDADITQFWGYFRIGGDTTITSAT